MDVPQIKDREHLEAWLKTRSREECIAIAHRAAMRVAPLWIGWIKFSAGERNSSSTEVVFFSPLLISGVAAFSATPEIKSAVRISNAFADPNIPIASTFAATAISHAAAAVTAVIDIFFASQATTAAASAVAAAASFAANLNPAAAAAIATLASEEVWKVIWQDLNAVQSGINPLVLPLWLEAETPIAGEWTRARADLVARGPDWDFWVRWYDAALHGQPLNWKMQEEIALLPSEVWEGDVAGLAAAIAAIELDHAIEATGNGEIIAFNPQTGKLFITPDTELPADIATYANRKLAKAIALFGENPANQYTALAPELKLLADTLADASNLPVEIFDACASVSRRVTSRVENGECPRPEIDALIADFLVRVREVGADILGNDSKTQQVLFKRHSIKGNSSLIKGRTTVLAAAGLISAGSEGFLASAIVENADVASDEAANPEESGIAAFKFVSRVFLIHKKVVYGVGGATIAVGAFVTSVDAIRFSQTVNEVYKLCLKWAGY